MSPAPVARVVLDSALPQLDRLFDYSVPERLKDAARPGVRVRVPLRAAGRIAGGYIVELAHGGDYDGALSELEDVVSPAPVLAPEIWRLARSVADRSAGSANDVLRLGIPPRMVRVEKAWLAREHDAPSSAPPRSTIEGYPPGAVEAVIDGNRRAAIAAIPRLVETPDGRWTGEWALLAARAALHTLARGRSAILVVPDYRDQHLLEIAFTALGAADAYVTTDARQPNPERYRAFLACLEAVPRIVVGNRSAVYAPAASLGMILIWDDGDPLHAEPLSPYAHARDVALLRSEQQGCALLIAGHTRSVETQRLVEIGYFGELAPARFAAPKVIATARQAPNDAVAEQSRIPPAAWDAARRGLETGPVLVQVARPGYAPVVACASCREPARCGRCGGPLGVTQSNRPPSCRLCGAIASDWSCDNCGGTTLRLVTAGSVRTGEELGRAFPGVRVIVADGERPLLAVGPEQALVITTRGAEPIAQGGYKAVLLLDGERMLARESLRVSDDCLRWWSNAAALSAPGAPTVLVGVGGALAAALGTWRHDRYAHEQLVDRRELSFPPAVRIASVTGRAETVAAAVSGVEHGSIIDVLGPVPVEGGLVRTIVRFDYSNGPAVAAALRSSVVRNATARRRPPVGRDPRPTPTLRVRFDDPEIL